MLPKECSRAELSSLLELTGRHIDRLAREGVVRRLAEGRFELEASVRGFIRHRERVTAEKFGAGGYTNVRIALTREKAMQARAARLEREGALLPVGDVERSWTAILGAFRSKLLSIPARLPPKLLRAKTTPEMGALLQKEIYALLNFLSSSTPAATRFGIAVSGGNGTGRDDDGSRLGRQAAAEDPDAEDQPDNDGGRAPRAVDAQPGSEPPAKTAAPARGVRRRGVA